MEVAVDSSVVKALGASSNELFDELYGAPIDEFGTVCEQLSALECAVRSALVTSVAALIADDAWAEEGATSPVAWLSIRLGMSAGEATDIVRVAASVSSLPKLFAKFSSGEISWAKLVLLARFVPGTEDEFYANEAPNMTLAALKSLARLREVKEDDFSEARRTRSLTWSLHDETLSLKANLPADLGAVVTTAIDRIAANATLDPISNCYPELFRSRADALVELASCSLASDADADRATVVVEVTAEALSGEGAGEINNSIAVPSETIRRLACDSRLQVVTTEDGHIVGIGNISRTIPPWLYRRLRTRDQGCRFPGCARRTWVHGHHMVHWEHDGPTNLDNLVLLCEEHHHFVHEQHWHIEGNPHGPLQFVAPAGNVITGHPPPLREEVFQRLIDKLSEPRPFLPPLEPVLE